MLVAIASTHGFPSKLIEFVFAFPQANIDVGVFMELLLVIEVYLNSVEWVPKLNKYIYGIKQASTNWFEHLKTGIKRRVYYQSKVVPCLFYINELVILTRPAL